MEVFYAVLWILGFVAILFAAYLVTRFMGSRMSSSKGTKYMKILDRLYLSNEKSICIIQVGRRYFLIGITNHHIDIINELEESDLIRLVVDQDNSFDNLFNKYIVKLRKNPKKYEEDKLSEIMEDLNRRKKV